MSVNEPDHGAPIEPGSPLARMLDGYGVPELSPGFADRVLAAAETRPDALPALRRPARGPRGWRMGRRIAVGIVSFGALATAAAATGLLQRLDIPVPSPGKVWASLTGSAAAAPVVPAAPRAAASPVAVLARVEIVGSIDTPEELGEAFRRIDEVRLGRREMRREMVDQRIAAELERRRAAGLPVPTAEEEAQIRERIDKVRTRRDQRTDALVDRRRAQLEQKVESGEALTRDDFLRHSGDERQALKRRERLERLRNLPPEERRARIEEWRQRRAQRSTEQGPAASPTPVAPETAAPMPRGEAGTDQGAAAPPI